MEYLREILMIALSAALINNFVLINFVGICPFVGVSKNVGMAFGMGCAVTFVITIASLLCWTITSLVRSQQITDAMVITNVTAHPIPKAMLTFFDTPIKAH